MTSRSPKKQAPNVHLPQRQTKNRRKLSIENKQVLVIPEASSRYQGLFTENLRQNIFLDQQHQNRNKWQRKFSSMWSPNSIKTSRDLKRPKTSRLNHYFEENNKSYVIGQKSSEKKQSYQCQIKIVKQLYPICKKIELVSTSDYQNLCGYLNKINLSHNNYTSNNFNKKRQNKDNYQSIQKTISKVSNQQERQKHQVIRYKPQKQRSSRFLQKKSVNKGLVDVKKQELIKGWEIQENEQIIDIL